MRLDNRVGYVITGIFVISMMVVGAELLYSAGIALQSGGDRGLLDLDEVLEDRSGRFVSVTFLVGFFTTSFSSLLGVWNGVSLLFADFVANVRGRADGPEVKGDSSTAFRGYLLWLTFPPMALLVLDRPIALVIAHGALGAFSMPFLAGTLLWLLDSKRVQAEHRNGWLSNTLLAGAALLFIVLCANELAELT